MYYRQEPPAQRTFGTPIPEKTMCVIPALHWFLPNLGWEEAHPFLAKMLRCC